MSQDQPHRCVVLVHGVGRQARGGTLLAFGEPFAWFVRHYLAADHSVEIETGLKGDEQGAGADAGGASSTIRACIETDPAGRTRDEVIRLHEAWWSERFLPTTNNAMYVWVAHMWWAQIRSVVAGMAHSLGRRRGPPAATLDSPIYEATARTPAATIYDVVMAVLMLGLIALCAPIILLAALLAWALGGVLRTLRFAEPFGSVTDAFEGIFLWQIAPVYLYMNSNHARASVRQAVIDTVAPLLTEEHRADCQSLTLVAHSWGSVVTLDALLALSRRPDIVQRPLTLLTVGAGLGRAWWLARHDALWHRLPEMRPWLAQIRWVNIWSRYDPVPAGPLAHGLRARLEESGATVYERHVVNTDDPFGDHQSYWRNDPEVQSIVAYEALGHPSPPYPGLLRSVAERRPRRRAVRALAFVRLATIIGVGLLLLAWAGGDETTLDLAFAGLAGAVMLALVCVIPPGGRLVRLGLGGSLLLLLGLVMLLIGRGVDELAEPSHLVHRRVSDLGSIMAAALAPLLLLLWYRIMRSFLFAPYIEFHPWMDSPGDAERRGGLGVPAGAAEARPDG